MLRLVPLLPCWILIGCLALIRGADALAQPAPGVISGRVSDSLGNPLAEAHVSVVGSSISLVTTDAGGFRTPALRPGRYLLRARKIGFEARTLDLEVLPDTQDVIIVLRELAQSLPQVIVSAQEQRYLAKLSGFAQRMHSRAVPAEAFITRAEIERRNPLRVTDLLRNGSARCGTRGFAVFLDGALMGPGTSPDMLSVREVEAMEVYRGPAQVPAQFNVTAARGAAPGCTLLIWTR